MADGVKRGERPKRPDWLDGVEHELSTLGMPYFCVVVDGRFAKQLGNIPRMALIDLLQHTVDSLIGEETAGLPELGTDVGEERFHG